MQYKFYSWNFAPYCIRFYIWLLPYIRAAARKSIPYRAKPDGARPCGALTYGIPEKAYFIVRSLTEHAHAEHLTYGVPEWVQLFRAVRLSRLLRNATFAIRSASCSCMAFAIYQRTETDTSKSKLTQCLFLCVAALLNARACFR